MCVVPFVMKIAVVLLKDELETSTTKQKEEEKESLNYGTKKKPHGSVCRKHFARKIKNFKHAENISSQRLDTDINHVFELDWGDFIYNESSDTFTSSRPVQYWKTVKQLDSEIWKVEEVGLMKAVVVGFHLDLFKSYETNVFKFKV